MSERILLVDDEPDFSFLLGSYLKKQGYRVSVAGTGGEAMRRFRDEEPDLVLLDVMLPDASGIDLVREMTALRDRVPVVMVSCLDAAQDVVAAMKFGATDYLPKPLSSFASAARKIQEILSASHLHTESSPAMVQWNERVARIAAADATVLIRGESGTGKTRLAAHIHAHSPRREAPFVTINCAAIPEELLESELFGHVRGAFTGAVVDKIGKFESARGGTVFLDEIGDLPITTQVKLLRLVQEHSFERLGDVKTFTADVRVMAATNRDLEVQMRAGVFREDLYYRLNVLPIHVPPLRERREEIPALISATLTRLARKQGQPFILPTPKAIDCLSAHSWPGNVRELENVLERAAVVAAGRAIDVADLAFLSETLELPEVVPAISVADCERDQLRAALLQTRGNRSQAARILGVSRETLYRRMRRYGEI